MPPTGCGGTTLWRCIPFSLHGLLASRKRLDHAYLYQSARLSGYGSRAQRVAYNPGQALSGAARCSPGSQALSEEQLERLHYVESRLPQTCSGCGVKLQRENSEAPGFFQIPKKLLELPAEPEQQPGLEQKLDETVQAVAPAVAESLGEAPEAGAEDDGPGKAVSYEDKLDAFESMLDGWMEPVEEDEAPLRFQEAAATSEAEAHGVEKPLHVLCTRCFSLTHYGKVKSQVAEQRMPRFDLSRSVGAKLKLVKYRLQVVLVVVDMVDFDGSLPRLALAQLLPDGMSGPTHEKIPPRELGFKLILALNKRDLLPASATAHRLKMWARQRLAEAGLPKPHSVHMVSAHTGAGVPPLLRDVHDSLGDRGDLYVVGAQNAGKSSLINAMRKLTRAPRSEDVTAASLPGTTLGLIEVPGLGLPSKCKAWDTPGVPHIFQLSTRLQPEEVKMLLPRSVLKPRSFRIPPGSTILVGGVARLDLLSCPGSSVYVTVWASSDIPCHLGKTQGAQDRWLKFAGSQLLPPLGEAGVQAAGHLEPLNVEVEGDSWRESTRDIHVAGCGWFAIGVKGRARFTAWAHQGIGITTRMALLPDYAKTFERPGFGNKTRVVKGSTQKALAKSAGGRKNSSGRRR